VVLSVVCLFGDPALWLLCLNQCGSIVTCGVVSNKASVTIITMTDMQETSNLLNDKMKVVENAVLKKEKEIIDTEDEKDRQIGGDTPTIGCTCSDRLVKVSHT
jgi:hypothetical protein